MLYATEYIEETNYTVKIALLEVRLIFLNMDKLPYMLILSEQKKEMPMR